MLRYVAATTLAVLALTVSQGCSMLTKAEEQRAVQNKQQVVELLNSFANNISQDDWQSAAKLISPAVNPEKAQKLTRKAKMASWLALYTGYELDARATVEDFGDDTWLTEKVKLEVPATNAKKTKWEDIFTVIKSEDDGWALLDYKLRKPLEGEALDLPEEHRKEIASIASWVLQQLKNDKPEKVLARLPRRTSSHYRQAKQSWWSSLFSSAGTHWLGDDLKRATEVNVQHWPDPENSLPVAFIGEGHVVVTYDIPYTWPEGGIGQTDDLRTEMFVVKTSDGWKLIMVRFYGKAIPESL